MSAPTPTAYKLDCPECGNLLQLRKSDTGYWYACEFYPQCKGSHGAHPDGRPLGIPADSLTKQWRIRAHEFFDQIYECYPKGKHQRSARHRAYQWMSYAMRLPVDQAHIGMFSIGQCQQLIELIIAENYTIAPYEDVMPLSRADKKKLFR